MSLAPTVLVVDDVEATRTGLTELLQLRGFQTREAGNGADALHCLREDHRICVVVLDLAMPDSNGYWFRSQQLTDPTIAHVPVIIFTGRGESDEIIDTLKVTDVLHKPVEVDALFDAITRCCERGPAAVL